MLVNGEKSGVFTVSEVAWFSSSEEPFRTLDEVFQQGTSFTIKLSINSAMTATSSEDKSSCSTISSAIETAVSELR
jgi:hypothetical protein